MTLLLPLQGHYHNDWATPVPFSETPPAANLTGYEAVQAEYAYYLYRNWTATDASSPFYKNRGLIVTLKHPTPYYDDSYANIEEERRGEERRREKKVLCVLCDGVCSVWCVSVCVRWCVLCERYCVLIQVCLSFFLRYAVNSASQGPYVTEETRNTKGRDTIATTAWHCSAQCVWLWLCAYACCCVVCG